ncbi:MAG: hypothetical protein AAF571_07585 [Verrucomicrobiota bacterium]
MDLYVLPNQESPPFTVAELENMISASLNPLEQEDSNSELVEDAVPAASEPEFYVHSGKMDPTSLVSTSILALLGGTVIGFICAYGQYYIPDPLACFGLVLILGMGLGAWSRFIVYFGHIRNTTVIIILSAVLVIITSYVCWLNWIYIYSGNQTFYWNPLELLEEILRVSHQQPWSLQYLSGLISWTPDSLSLKLIWISEIAFLFLVTVFSALHRYKRSPYCEQCKEWLTKYDRIPELEEWLYPGALAQDMCAGNFDSLKALQAHQSGRGRTDLTLHYCQACSDKYYLSVDAVLIAYDDEGDQYAERSSIVELLKIPSEVGEELCIHWDADQYFDAS